MFAQTHWF